MIFFNFASEFQQQGQRPRYQIHLNSQNGPICVLLVNHDTKSDSPVVVPVPPPTEQSVQTPAIGEVKIKQSNESKPSTDVIKEETIEEKLQSNFLFLILI